MKFIDGKLFSNIYALIVAPAGSARKNTAIELPIRLMRYLENELLAIDRNIAGMKMLNPFESRATPEALVTAMLPENQRGQDFIFRHPDDRPMTDAATGEILKYFVGSELAVCQPELAVLFGKQSYLESLIGLFLSFYDCRDSMPTLTQGRGTEELVNVFVTFLAAMTPTALKETLPTAVIGDGFLSRAVVVYQPFTERIFAEPFIPSGAPSLPEMRKRLAWIAANTWGEWQWSDEARAYHEIMYRKDKLQNAVDGMYQGIKSRSDAIIRKVAMLVRWQRYERSDNLIHLQDLLDAEYIVKRTFSEASPMYRAILSSQGNDRVLKVEEYIRRLRCVSRGKIMRSGHCAGEDVSTAVNQLLAEGKIKILLNNKERDIPSRNIDEEYYWITEKNELRMLAEEIRPGLKLTHRGDKPYTVVVENKNGTSPEPGGETESWSSFASRIANGTRQIDTLVPDVPVIHANG